MRLVSKSSRFESGPKFRPWNPKLQRRVSSRSFRADGSSDGKRQKWADEKWRRALQKNRPKMAKNRPHQTVTYFNCIPIGSRHFPTSKSFKLYVVLFSKLKSRKNKKTRKASILMEWVQCDQILKLFSKVAQKIATVDNSKKAVFSK